MSSKRLACRIMGHRWRFSRDGAVIRWTCGRGCPVEGTRAYASEAEAKRYMRYLVRAPGPPSGLLAALGGTVDRTGTHRRRS